MQGRQDDMWGTGLPTVSEVVKNGIPERQWCDTWVSREKTNRAAKKTSHGRGKKEEQNIQSPWGENVQGKCSKKIKTVSVTGIEYAKGTVDEVRR